MKTIKRIFHLDDESKKVFTFSFSILHSKRFKNLTEIEKKQALEFIDDCEKDLQIFRNRINGLK